MVVKPFMYHGVARAANSLRDFQRIVDTAKVRDIIAAAGQLGALKETSAFFLFSADTDPLNIIYKKTNMLIGKVLVGGGTRSPEALKYNELFYLFKQSGMMLLMAAAGMSLIGMMLTTKANIIEEKKRSVQNKIFLFFILCSSVTLFNALKQFFDYLIY